jgi:excisionase family DNA binding protein
MTDAPEYLRAGEIARLSGASVRTVRRWIADEILPSVKVRGMRLVPRKALERLLSAIGKALGYETFHTIGRKASPRSERGMPAVRA